MRRQVKPFVTEYRGNTRRVKDHSGDQQEVQAPRSRSFAEAEKIFHIEEKVFPSEGPDDSYEAALRAADALFNASDRDVGSAPGIKGVGRAPASRNVSHASSPFHIQPDEAAKGVFTQEDLRVAAKFEPGEQDHSIAPRRILQAIEPQTEERFAALEAERAPKRRGRKPGSKNKPKIVVSDDWASPVARPMRASVPTIPTTAPAVRSPNFPRISIFVEPELDEILETVAAEQTLPQPRGRNDRFGWKRAGLRPGERWKRRLPKAAW